MKSVTSGYARPGTKPGHCNAPCPTMCLRSSCAVRTRKIGPLRRESMPNIQTFIVEPGTPELAICARWRANAFSVLEASFKQELRSLELFASDRSQGVALMAKAD